jgi:hypothetical protein
MLDTGRHTIVGLLVCSFFTAGFTGSAAIAQTVETAKPSPAEQSLLDAESMRFHAQLEGNVPTLEQGIAAEAIYTHTSGMVQTKEEYLHGVKGGFVHYRSLEPSNRSSRVYGNVGVTHGTIAMDAGPDRQTVARYTGVYIQRDGRWQLLAWQTTTIALPK